MGVNFYGMLQHGATCCSHRLAHHMPRMHYSHNRECCTYPQGTISSSGSSVRDTRMVSPKPSISRAPMPMADFMRPSSPSPACTIHTARLILNIKRTPS